MKITALARRSALALTLTAAALGGTVLGSASAASAAPSPIATPIVSRFQNVVVSQVEIFDYQHLGQPDTISYPPTAGFAGYTTVNPYRVKNPLRMKAHDELLVCATVKARFRAVAAASMSLTGPDYNTVIRTDALAAGASARFCTSQWYSVDWTNAAANGLLSIGSHSTATSQQCIPIVLTASVPGSSAKSAGFFQDGLKCR